MGLIANSVGFQALGPENPSQPLLPPGFLYETSGSDSGLPVTEPGAIRLTTAYGCMKVISEDLSALPRQILQHMPDDSTRLALEHPNWYLICVRPNRYMTAMVFWGALLAGVLAYGNGYAWIKRDRAARALELVILDPARTTPMLVNGELVYATTQTETGVPAKIDPANILHIRGLTFNGILGLSPIRTCMNAFGLALAAEKFGAQFFGNGARASGVFSHPNALEPEAYENLKKSVRAWATGDNALNALVVEEGMKWQQLTIPPDEAQFLVTRQFQRAEIAGAIYRVALHLIGDLSRATNNNIEHQSLDHSKYCLRPWAVRIEQEVNLKLLAGSFFMEHNFRDLTRGDLASQTTAIQTLRHCGLYSANDGLRDLRLNPIPANEGGDTRMVQGAMIPLTAMLDRDNDGLPQPADPDDNSPSSRLARAFYPMVRDAVGRVLNRNGRDGADQAFVQRAFRPVVISMMEATHAVRFGVSQLTPRSLEDIDAALADIAAAACAWQPVDAPQIAQDLNSRLYARLAAS